MEGKNVSTLYVLEADLQGFFDNISHGWLMEKVPKPYKHFLKEWLKAPKGVVDFEAVIEPTNGTPQGGVISPLLANVALAGLEACIKGTLPKTRKPRKGGRGGSPRTLRKINVVRYADDFVVTLGARGDAKTVVNAINTFLNESPA